MAEHRARRLWRGVAALLQARFGFRLSLQPVAAQKDDPGDDSLGLHQVFLTADQSINPWPAPAGAGVVLCLVDGEPNARG